MKILIILFIIISIVTAKQLTELKDIYATLAIQLASSSCDYATYTGQSCPIKSITGIKNNMLKGMIGITYSKTDRHIGLPLFQFTPSEITWHGENVPNEVIMNDHCVYDCSKPTIETHTYNLFIDWFDQVYNLSNIDNNIFTTKLFINNYKLSDMHNLFFTGDVSVIDNIAQYIVYDLAMDLSKIQINNITQLALSYLPTEYDFESYQLFDRYWGTYVVTNASFGMIAEQLISIKECVINATTQSFFENQAIYEILSTLYPSQYSPSYLSFNYTNYRTSSATDLFGGDPTISIDQIDDRFKTAMLDPSLVEFTGSPIWYYLNEPYKSNFIRYNNEIQERYTTDLNNELDEFNRSNADVIDVFLTVVFYTLCDPYSSPNNIIQIATFPTNCTFDSYMQHPDRCDINPIKLQVSLIDSMTNIKSANINPMLNITWNKECYSVCFGSRKSDSYNWLNDLFTYDSNMYIGKMFKILIKRDLNPYVQTYIDGSGSKLYNSNGTNDICSKYKNCQIFNPNKFNHAFSLSYLKFFIPGASTDSYPTRGDITLGLGLFAINHKYNNGKTHHCFVSSKDKYGNQLDCGAKPEMCDPECAHMFDNPYEFCPTLAGGTWVDVVSPPLESLCNTLKDSNGSPPVYYPDFYCSDYPFK